MRCVGAEGVRGYKELKGRVHGGTLCDLVGFVDDVFSVA